MTTKKTEQEPPQEFAAFQIRLPNGVAPIYIIAQVPRRHLSWLREVYNCMTEQRLMASSLLLDAARDGHNLVALDGRDGTSAAVW